MVTRVIGMVDTVGLPTSLGLPTLGNATAAQGSSNTINGMCEIALGGSGDI